ncbi:MAG: hypothetical protein RB296_09675, partial [Acidobacteriota bacterium]|nr:hypothetical protein [Acidobacteriota bacterium]
RFTTSLWKTLRVYHIPTTASILYYSCVKIYADLLRKNIRLLTPAKHKRTHILIYDFSSTLKEFQMLDINVREKKSD